ncbi:MAG: hypothetical protein GXO25_02545 [Euryarchaeota archaeon]|nr:hypothetical protein [Euryarchaeota archaeon]
MSKENRLWVGRYSSENLVGRESFINGTNKPYRNFTRKKGPKGRKGLVILLVIGFMMASLVVITYKSPDIAPNGFILGEPVPYEKSYSPSLIAHHTFLGYAKSSQKIGLVIGFKWRNSTELNVTLRAINNPNSPMYRHYLTWEEFKKKYAPSKEVYDAMVNWLKEKGVHIEHTWPLRNAISIVDTAGNIEKAFGTKIGVYEGDGVHTRKYFYSITQPLNIPSNVIPYISGISGTNNAPKYHLNFHTNSTGSRFVFASDLQKMYHILQLYNNSATAAPTSSPIFAKGLRIATVLWEGNTGGWSASESPPFDPANVEHYWQHVIPKWEQNEGGMPTVWGYGTESDCVAPGADTDETGANVENELDLEMVGVMAPGIDVVCVYSDSSQTNFPSDNYNYILNYLAHNSTLVAVSNSWGGGDTSVDTTTMSDVQALNALGVTVLASSGDDGDTTTPSEPSTAALDNYGFIAVGGTTPTPNGIDDSSTSLDTDYYQTMGNNTNLTDPRSNEVVWYDSRYTNSNGDHYGTQSGVSSTYSEPSWQSTYIGTYNGRVTADISADGNATIIYYTYYDSNSGTFSTGWYGIAGTSVACPVTAGMLGAMAAYAGRMYDGQGTVTSDNTIYGFGFFAPTIYKLGHDYYSNGLYSSSPPFFDVTQGSTAGGGSAAVGWDQVSGWGVIDAWNFIHDIGPYMSAQVSNITVTAGNSGSYTISIWFPYDWTSEMGHFQVLGLPAGASFTTNVTSVHPPGGGVASLVNFTISTSTTTPAGTYSLTIVAYTYNSTSNQWGNLSASTVVTLVVTSAVPEISTNALLPLLIITTGLIAVWRRRTL